MIAKKGDIVRVVLVTRDAPENQTAKVLSLTYLDQPQGQRGVQLDKALGGSRWWLESDLTLDRPAVAEIRLEST